ncbi:hypothetical protein WDW89_13550 [Deltaproteobacteria bacterium TL4]
MFLARLKIFILLGCVLLALSSCDTSRTCVTSEAIIVPWLVDARAGDVDLTIVALEGDIAELYVDGKYKKHPPFWINFPNENQNDEEFNTTITWKTLDGKGPYSKKLKLKTEFGCPLGDDSSYTALLQGTQLELKNTLNDQWIGTPQRVGHLTDVIQISAGWGHTCALLSDQTVKCWSRSVYPPETVVDISNATQITAGFTHTCALLSNQTVKCWGKNEKGQLGDGTAINSDIPVLVESIVNATQVATRYNSTCALLSNQTVKCWGENIKGQLGDGTKNDSNIPVLVNEIFNATQISTGSEHTCALLSDQTVKCWGHNYAGQLGDGLRQDSPNPVSVKGLNNAIQIVAGSGRSMAILSDYTIQAWGKKVGNPSELRNVTQLETSSNAFCALFEDQTVKCSGSMFLWGNITDVTQISVYGHGCALLSDQTVKCWGLW